MKDIKITVTKKIASVEGTPIIVCGNSDYTLSFTFDDEWSNEQSKVARFNFVKNGLKSFIDVPIHDNTCQVPVLIGIGLVRVGVYAGDLKTTTGAKIKCHKSILCDDADTMDEPFENLYEELKEEIDEIRNTQVQSDVEIIAEFNDTQEYETNQVYNANSVNAVFLDVVGAFDEVVKAVQKNEEDISALKGQQAVIDEVSLLVGGAE